jgi:hypothetical protein
MSSLHPEYPLSRRELLCRLGGGFGALGLAGVLANETPAVASGPLSPKAGHFPAKVKRVIFLFMNGGPSHVDTFDPKPELEKFDGKDPTSSRSARAGGRG